MSSNVLIVEDEALVALELRENAERLGHTVIDVTDSAEAAVSLAIQHKPDLVIMDVRLSGSMDGIDAAALIHESVDIPIIFLTAYSGDEMLKRATRTQPYGYLIKPVHERQLAGAIQVALRNHHRDARLRDGFRNASTILRALPNAVVVTDTTLNVRYLNKSAETLLGIKTMSAVGRSLGDTVNLADTRLDSDSIVGFDEVLNDGRSVMLGEYYLKRSNDDPLPVQIEVSPLIERDGLIIGSLVNLMEVSDEVASFKEVAHDILSTEDEDPLINEKGDLRSYLEVEIVRLSMNNPESHGDSEASARLYRDGQIAACKRVLRFMFGEKSLEEIEAILPVESQHHFDSSESSAS